jgi:hypothetical protein
VLCSWIVGGTAVPMAITVAGPSALTLEDAITYVVHEGIDDLDAESKNQHYLYLIKKTKI